MGFVLSCVALGFLLTVSPIASAMAKGNTTVSYQGFKTYMVMPHTEGQVKLLRKLSDARSVDFWSPPSLYVPSSVMVGPSMTSEFMRIISNHHIPFNTTIPNVARVLEKEKQQQKDGRGRRYLRGYLSKYLRYSEMINLLKGLASEYSGMYRLQVIGSSFEGRPIYMVRISSDFKATKPVVMVEAGMHAREWAAPAMALHIIHQALQSPELLQHQDWHVIPCANPDGYEYTHTTDRLWRKTRSVLSRKGKCVGADGNRNFNVHWAEIGSSANPCSEIYHGTAAFSESETRAVRDAAAIYRRRIRVYLSVHSYGNFILYPFGHTKTLTSDWRILDECGRKAAKTILSHGGPEFTVGNTATVLYPSGAGSDDYMKMKQGVGYAYTIELPGGGKEGFDLPPDEISTMVHQVFPGLSTLAACWQSI